LRPTPYTASSAFALAEPVSYRPDLDDHRLAVSQPSNPREAEATPGLVTACLTNVLVRSEPFAIAPVGAHSDASFAITLQLTLVAAGSTSLSTREVGMSVTAPAASASASAPVVTAGGGEEAVAAGLLEIRAPDGTPIDRVRIFAQRFPRDGEPLESRAEALCEILAAETEHYLAWRIAGNG
jgi:hypothetical protein